MTALAVVSPHLDDAVLSCGDLIARRHPSVVITVFAGHGGPRSTPTPWDAASGFAASDDAIAQRRNEDAAACAIVGATPVWLPFRDAQYGKAAAPDALVDSLADELLRSRPDEIAVPLGLFHEDHMAASDAGIAAARRSRPEQPPLVYADWPYARMRDLVDHRLRVLTERGADLVPVRSDVSAFGAAKRRAVACYRSQIRAFAANRLLDLREIVAPEQYWRLRWR